jgi:hypothetical protein
MSALPPRVVGEGNDLELVVDISKARESECGTYLRIPLSDRDQGWLLQSLGEKVGHRLRKVNGA